ncbi:hypothetical protein [Saccharothrix sp. NRRL B-16348]|uniref:hypothetical protein n=1 Tax=Saccharothrix sp. NRRL B-16348 TaxID=1415542 RepID=UPI0006AE068A|nr:hypothetical protein [Saccharothrix sp. NRRL B-16348]
MVDLRSPAAAHEVQDEFLRKLRLSTAAIAGAVLLLLDGPSLLLALRDFAAPAVQITAYLYLCLLVVVEWLLMRWGRSWGKAGRPAAVTIVIAHVAATASLAPGQVLEQADWSTGVVGWVTLCVLFGHPLSTLLPVLLLELGISAASLVAVAHADEERLFGGLVALTAILAFQVCVGGTAAALVRLAAAADAAHRAVEETTTTHRVAIGLHEARKARYAELSTSALPLLEGLLSGALDPADPDVRRRCGIEAARMRRLFAEADDAEDPLLHELDACIDVAERRGIEVHLEVNGPIPPLPRPVRHLLTEAPLVVVTTARSSVRLVVLGTPDAVSVSAVGDCPPIAPQEIGDPRVVVTQLTTAGLRWVRAEHKLVTAGRRS